ncbi:ABC transporter permease [Gulbenkiania mobilis]|uniref:ABC transport system permease protein n=1 Tax=Gulbenkiania mobilis TaxID=397457 RepID=A0ABY2D167_GULMO|nr:putative ABC transport system permease protein [Gulbenkiania mobilis]
MRRLARWAFALRLARREWLSGELSLLTLALAVAVAAMTSVAFFSDRIERALTQQASQLLAADLVLNGDMPASEAFRAEARRRGLRLAETATFPSMAFARGQAVLASYKAVSAGYPLRGEVQVRDGQGQVHAGRWAPAPGTAWMDDRLARRLGVHVGETVEVGGRTLRLAGILQREPDGAMDLYNFVPRLVFNQADLAATGLVQTGSRVRWRLLVAGSPDAVAGYRAWLAPRLPRAARLEDVEEARPEVRTALERARRFLGLTAMLTVALSAAAVAMAVRRYLARHWQPVAVLRCLGLTGREVWQVFATVLLTVAGVAGVLGTVAGYGVQLALTRMAAAWVGDGLPSAGWLPWLMGPASAVLLLAGLALPPLTALRRVPPVAVLRNEFVPTRQGVLVPLLALATLLGLSAWQVGDVTLAGWLLGALFGFLAGVAALAAGVLGVLRRLPLRPGPGGRFALAGLARRPWLAIIQTVALSVGLMALLTLTVVRSDLIAAWQKSLPADAPNTFVINIQPDQREGVRQHFRAAGLPEPDLSPMIRARLVAINGKTVRPAAYTDDRARRLAEREFNLSWRATLPAGNRVSRGAWWSAGSRVPQFSVEKGLADTLGIRLGDTLGFDIAGTLYRAQVTSLREVAWDSFRVNFFVIAPAGWLEGEAASWITSFRLPPRASGFGDGLVAAFPNLTVIDVTAILQEVRAVVDRLSRAIETMFALALAAGILVLWAALAATRDERLSDLALMRALGATRAQLRRTLLAELAGVGALAGLLAGLGALAIGAVAGQQLFNLPLSANLWLLPLGAGAGVVVVIAAGWPMLRRLLRASPLDVLRNV